MNILNPALTARAFLFFAYPSWMSGDKVWVQNASVDGYSGATILGDLASSMNWQSLSGQWSISDMFFGTIPGSVGETSMVAIILGALILLFTGVGSWRIILSTFLGGYFMAYLFNLSIPVLANKETNFVLDNSAAIQPYYSDSVTGYISKEMNYEYTLSLIHI